MKLAHKLSRERRSASRPTRARGLKRERVQRAAKRAAVAPHAGAWIETVISAQNTARRGVAPHAGAWIETRFGELDFADTIVAPHAGAWIETPLRMRRMKRRARSRPTRARGLKLRLADTAAEYYDVAPHAGAWIETSRRCGVGCTVLRRAPRGRVD